MINDKKIYNTFKIGDLVHCGDNKFGIIIEKKTIGLKTAYNDTIYNVYFSDDLRTWWCDRHQLIKI